jgi:hypothetical protein
MASFNLPGLGLHSGPSNGTMHSSVNGTAPSQDDPTLSLERLLAESRSSAAAPPHANQSMPLNGLMGPPQQYPPTPPHPQPQPEPQPEIKQDPSQELPQNNGPQSPAAPEVEVPQCLIYGGATGEDEFLIPGRSLQKLPKDVLANLLKEGDRMGALHRLGSTPNWESLIRLGQYLEFEEYKPFKPHTPLEYLDAAGTAIQWASRDSPNAVEIPNATYELFLREIDFYLYMAKIGYAELRRTSAERLCTRYPKSVKSIWALIDKVPQVAVQNGDTGMMQRLVSYINTNIKELSVLPEFLPLLRKLTRGRPPLGPVLLEAFISSSLAARRELNALPESASARSEAPNQPSGLMARITGPSPTPTSSVTMQSPALPPPPRNPNFSSPFSAYEIPALVEALRHQNMVVANDNGYGTLVRDGQRTARNREFEFVKGELLVADRDASTVNGRHNIKVMNSRGEVGDILRTLVKKVPAGLGVLSQGKF